MSEQIPTAEPADYREQVYAGLLGKIIGVYVGRPFEGWRRAHIEKRWGSIDRYVHEDVGKPLVVTDDDISGTVAFIRALEDSGLYADTPEDFFGDHWLNCLLEGQTILWWGGMYVSTEHTAFLRLKHGVRAPESGSMRLNGQLVAEQIGAQIFIDGFGLVAPGQPELAARLATRAARVSHDGEAVLAARVVAAMVAAAFVEKDMDRVLDTGVSVIPPDSLVARVHRDVRAWAAADGDWRATHDRIAAQYGYDRYGGGCHVIPNHALMVMAWAYAGDDFHEAMRIVNTAGWDTDCNAANVGTVTALVAGLDGIDRKYPFRPPVADRVISPSAEGTDSVADILRLADGIARIGRRVMGWPDAPPAKDGAWHHFSLPGAVHGYAPDPSFASRPHSRVENAAAPEAAARALGIAVPATVRGLSFDFDLGPGRCARVLTPVCPPLDSATGGYQQAGVPYIYNGATLRVRGATTALDAPASLRLRVTAHNPVDATRRRVLSPPAALKAGEAFDFEWTIEGCAEEVLVELAIEAEGPQPGRGSVWIDRVDCGGNPRIGHAFAAHPPPGGGGGWIARLDNVYSCPVDPEAPALPAIHVGEKLSIVKNEGRGVIVTGHRRWRDATLDASLHIKGADRAGVILCWQGMERYYAALFDRTTVRWVRRRYGETELARADFAIPPDGAPLHLQAARVGNVLALSIDGREVLRAEDDAFDGGGVGFYVEQGKLLFRVLSAGARHVE